MNCDYVVFRLTISLFPIVLYHQKYHSFVFVSYLISFRFAMINGATTPLKSYNFTLNKFLWVKCNVIACQYRITIAFDILEMGSIIKFLELTPNRCGVWWKNIKSKHTRTQLNKQCFSAYYISSNLFELTNILIRCDFINEMMANFSDCFWNKEFLLNFFVLILSL